jgi:hypothetical protein
MIKSKETGACYENWKRERSPAYQRCRNEEREGRGGKKDERRKNMLYLFARMISIMGNSATK